MEQKEKSNPLVYIKGVNGRGKEVITKLIRESGKSEKSMSLYLMGLYLSDSFGTDPSYIYYMNPFGDGIQAIRLRGLSTARFDFFNSHYTEIFLSKPILDEKEREYLSAVIRPWRNRVSSITKFRIDPRGFFLGIRIEDSDASWLPYFKGGMYEGMEDDREYTLKELNL